MADNDNTRSLQDTVADEDFQKKEHAILCAGWVFMLLIIVAALAGLFGQGALSERELEAGSLKMKYQYFLRHSTPTELKFSIKETATADQTVSLALDSRYLTDLKIDAITPRPEETLDPEGPIFHFKLSESRKPVQVTMHVQPQGFGFLHGKVRINDESEQEFTQFVYP